MTAHLLLFTIGPVQDFIAQARRTRDLWQGSHLLSELARAAARALVDAEARLVFPALARGDAELVACPTPLRASNQPPLNIANRLLAELPDSAAPAAVARNVRDAVQRYWRDEIAAPVKRACARLLADGIDAAWNEQIDSFPEFAAAWAPLGDYVAARRDLDRAVAARKHLREFAPWRQLRGGVPKSSLDGARETVLERPERRDEKLVRKYKLSEGEQLDAVGLVKRAGGDPKLADDDVDDHDIQFAPIFNVALASWVALAAREAPEKLAALSDACRDLKLPRVLRKIPCAEAFPFDAGVLLRSRWKSVFKERGLTGDPESWGRAHVASLHKELFEPYPYVACLVADGDHMGRAIERLASADVHRAFSRALSDFAGEARRIVEQEHLGSLVYAGGDDVLAFLPLPEALACAGALRHGFARVMAAACPGLAETDRPTLSVGLGVSHVMESMGEMLALGREAEKLAKGGVLANENRNALAVIVDKRSGGQISWRARWTTWDNDPAARLRTDAALLAEQLSSRKIYEIAQTLVRLPTPGSASDPAWARILALEVRRSLARTRGGEAGIELDAIGLSLDDHTDYAALHRDVGAWVERMLVARVFASADPPQRPKKEAA